MRILKNYKTKINERFKNMIEQKFIVSSYGDPSVGFHGMYVEVTFASDDKLNSQDIKEIKEFLQEFYDVLPNEVFTEEEMDVLNRQSWD